MEHSGCKGTLGLNICSASRRVGETCYSAMPRVLGNLVLRSCWAGVLITRTQAVGTFVATPVHQILPPSADGLARNFSSPMTPNIRRPRIGSSVHMHAVNGSQLKFVHSTIAEFDINGYTYGVAVKYTAADSEYLKSLAAYLAEGLTKTGYLGKEQRDNHKYGFVG